MSAGGARSESPSGRAGPFRPGRGALAGLIAFALPLLVLIAGGRYVGSGDTAPAELIPISLLTDGDFDLREFVTPDLPPPYWARRIGGRVVSNYPIWPGLLNVPAYAAAKALGVPLEENRFRLSLVTAALLVAFSCYFLYRALALVCRSRAEALFFALVFFFATPAWSVAGKGLFQHGPSLLFLSLSLWLLLEDSAPATAASGLALALAVVNRPTNVLIAMPLAVFVLRHRRGRPLFFALAAIPALLHAAYCWRYWGSPFSFGQDLPGGSFAGDFREGLAGILVSPSRGLLVFSPIFLFAIPAVVAAFRRSAPALDRALAIGVLLVVAVYARWSVWWGGHSFGYRLLIEIAPLLVFLLARAWPEIETLPLARPLFGVCLAASIFAQFLGARIYPSGFNLAAERNPNLLWSVSRSELAIDTRLFLRSLGLRVAVPAFESPETARARAPAPDPVWWTPETTDEQIPAALDTLRENAVVHGHLRLSGWAASVRGPVEVQILLAPADLRLRPIRGPRLDVCRVFPDFGDCSRAGFFASVPRPEGASRLQALVLELRDSRGCVRRFGPVDFFWHD